MILSLCKNTFRTNELLFKIFHTISHDDIFSKKKHAYSQNYSHVNFCLPLLFKCLIMCACDDNTYVTLKNTLTLTRKVCLKTQKLSVEPRKTDDFFSRVNVGHKS